MDYALRPVDPQRDTWLDDFLTEQWGSKYIACRGQLYDGSLLPGFIASTPTTRQEQILGVVLYRLDGQNCELCVLNSLVEDSGIGTALVAAVRRTAVEAGCSRLWLITTNDNLRAIRFYQRRGFTLAAVHANALAYSRLLKPEIPEIGLDGIPLRDELEFEMQLKPPAPLDRPDFPRRLSRRTLYSSNWICLHLDRIQLTTSRVIEDFHVVESPKSAVSALVENEQGELLFEQVYRYPTGRLEWEIPAGGIDPGETPLAAASREVFEETGYHTTGHRLVYHFYPANGNTTLHFFIVHCKAAARSGADDPAEILQSQWLDREQIDQMLASNEIQDGLTLVALLLHKEGLSGQPPAAIP